MKNIVIILLVTYTTTSINMKWILSNSKWIYSSSSTLTIFFLNALHYYHPRLEQSRLISILSLPWVSEWVYAWLYVHECAVRVETLRPLYNRIRKCTKQNNTHPFSPRLQHNTCAFLIQCCAVETELKHSVRYTIESGCVKAKQNSNIQFALTQLHVHFWFNNVVQSKQNSKIQSAIQ